jgi:hypothetical protein
LRLGTLIGVVAVAQKLAQIRAGGNLRAAVVMVMALSWLALTTPPAKGDIGVVGVSPRHANPGEEVNVSIGSGTSISSPTGGGPFPVSLVPLADTPEPHRCDSSAAAVCLPAALGPPRDAPFVYLGRATRVKNQDKRYVRELRSVQEYRLHFQVPAVTPGRYSFVIYSAGSYPGPRGGLIVDYSKDGSKLLRVGRGSVGGDGGDGMGPLWVAVVAAIVGITLGGVVLRRQRSARLTRE